MLALAFSLLLQAQPAVPAPAQFVGPYVFREHKDHVTKVVLKNGLTVLVQEQSVVPLASVTTYVKAGYFDEEDRLNGISHVIEHMFFKGTPTRAAGEIARETKALGGYLNAYTYYEQTVYRTVVPAENVLAALEIQSDALWNPIFDAGELSREIEVVLQENNRKLDNPSAVAAEKLYATAFEEHRMRRWRIGTAEGLRSLTRDDVVAYYQKFYRPSNIILVVVGRVDAEQVLAEIVKLYGNAPADDPDAPFVREPSPPESRQMSPRYAAERGPIQQAHVAMGFHTPGVLTPDARSLEVLGAVLGSGRASRLLRILRDEKNLITDGSAGLNGFRDLGFFEIDMRTTHPVEAQVALLAEIEAIKRSGVTQEELARARMMVAQEYLHRLETVDTLGDELATHEARGDWKGLPQYLSEIEKVDAGRVVDAARRYLTTENLSVFEYLPSGVTRSTTIADFETAVLDQVEQGIKTQSAAGAQAKRDELSVEAEMPVLDASLASEIVGTIQRRSMTRGPDIYILEDHRLPLVSFGIFYPGGRLYETAKNAGITELMLRSALRGSKQFDTAAISRRLENAGARVRIVNEPDFFGYILDGVAGTIGDAVAVLMDVLHQPVFDEQQITAEKEQQIARIRSLRDDNTTYPVTLFLKSLFGEHPYARPAAGTEESVSRLTNTELRDWFRNNQRTVVPSIIIVGDARGTGLVAPHADELTNEDLVVRDLRVLPRPQPAEPRETSEAIRRNQTALVYGFPGVSRAVEDRAALDVFVNIVSGLGGRFFEAIREKEGLAYTVRTSNASWTKGGAVYTYTAFSPDNEQQVRAALDAQYERLRNEGVTAEELERAIEYSIGERDIALQTRGAQVLEFARTIFAGENVQSVARYSASLQSVTRERIQAVIKQYMSAGGLRIGVVHGTP